MPRLPDQMTGEGLRALLDRYEADLDRLTALPSPPLAEVRSVVGGAVARRAGGWAVVAPDGRLRRATSGPTAGFRSRYPVVEVELAFAERAPRGVFHLRTGPAALVGVAVGTDASVVVDEGFLADPSRVHVFDLGGRVADTVRLTFVVYTDELAVAPLEAGLPVAPEADRFEIPPAATALYGEGVVRYATGQAVRASPDGPVPLLRPTEDGGLAVRPGGVYAHFEGARPALAKVGTAWVPTPRAQ